MMDIETKAELDALRKENAELRTQLAAMKTALAEWEQTAQDCDSGNICITCGQTVP